jgi:murein DD-endopeptidase MepM/ murein hydrolase activator NlpD
MPNVLAVTARTLAGAFRLPLRVDVTVDSVRAPGAPRTYRHGIHQGTDFYGVAKGTSVYPIAEGIVVRRTEHHVAMTPVYRRDMLERCRELGATPGEHGVAGDPAYGDVLDQLRGRQVWLYHGDNESGEPIVSVYAHLNGVGPTAVGDFVGVEQAIGRVGNSGTSQEGISDTEEMHLHLEIYIGDEYWSPRELDEVGQTFAEGRTLALRRETLSAFTHLPSHGGP